MRLWCDETMFSPASWIGRVSIDLDKPVRLVRRWWESDRFTDRDRVFVQLLLAPHKPSCWVSGLRAARLEVVWVGEAGDHAYLALLDEATDPEDGPGEVPVLRIERPDLLQPLDPASLAKVAPDLWREFRRRPFGGHADAARFLGTVPRRGSGSFYADGIREYRLTRTLTISGREVAPGTSLRVALLRRDGDAGLALGISTVDDSAELMAAQLCSAPGEHFLALKSEETGIVLVRIERGGVATLDERGFARASRALLDRADGVERGAAALQGLEPSEVDLIQKALERKHPSRPLTASIVVAPAAGSGASFKIAPVEAPVSIVERRVDGTRLNLVLGLEKDGSSTVRSGVAACYYTYRIVRIFRAKGQLHVLLELPPEVTDPDARPRFVLRVRDAHTLQTLGEGELEAASAACEVDEELARPWPASKALDLLDSLPRGRSIEPPERGALAEKLGGGVSLELAAIPAGRFLMGAPPGEPASDPEDGPQHEVSVGAFLMGRLPVTQAQWRAVAGLPSVSCDLDPEPSRFRGDDRPVESVTWAEACEFCQRLTALTGRLHRLPSEAEWEYACRAGTETAHAFGDTLSNEDAHFGSEQTTISGSVGRPNGFGLYDMHGNVRELCLDIWHESYRGAPEDGRAWTEGGDRRLRVVRGGSYACAQAWGCRSAGRIVRHEVSSRRDDTGFRVVAEATSSADEKPGPGAKVGSFRIVRLLETTSLTAVYEAEQMTLCARRVTLKVLRGSRAAIPEALECFRRIAARLARCQHPNIPSVHEAGFASGFHFIALEPVSGSDLWDAMRREGRPADGPAIAIVRAIASALDHAHGRGIVHSELHPGRVRFDDDARPLLWFDEDGSIGNPSYAAPEEVMGMEPGPRTDVYRLGVTAFEVLTGHQPFREAGNMNALLALKLFGPPPSMRAYRADLSESADRVVQAALDVDPSHRPMSATELAETLAAALGLSGRGGRGT